GGCRSGRADRPRSRTSPCGSRGPSSRGRRTLPPARDRARRGRRDRCRLPRRASPDPGTQLAPHGRRTVAQRLRPGPPPGRSVDGSASHRQRRVTPQRRRRSMRTLLPSLMLLLVVATPACSVARGNRPARPAATPAPSGAGYPGFGFKTTGGAGRPVFTVTTLADSGPGSLRAALSKAERQGGTIRFAVGGEIVLGSGLDIPTNTPLHPPSPPPPPAALRGEGAGARGTGVINLYESNVIVRGVRIRNAMNDGVHVVPRRGPLANIVLDHCSITNSDDGGVDITGRNGLPVTDVTIIANYLAGNGGPCPKGMCGGASLVKYGATRVSYYYNFFDKNLRRTPAISGADAVADVRYNVVRAPVQGGMQIREGATANLVGNALIGPKATVAVKLWGGRAH